MRFWTTSLALLLLAFPAQAQDQTKSASVMKIQAPPELQEPAITLQEALRREVQINKDIAPALKGSDMTIDDGLAFSDCEDITPECLDQISALLSSTMLIFGTLSVDSGGALALSLRWYVAGVGFQRQLSERFDDGAALSNMAEGLARRLIQGELGHLVVSSSEAGAAVLLNGRQIGLTPFDGEVPVGTHMLGLQKEGFLSTGQQEITVELNGSHQASMTLIPSHLAVVDDSAHPLVLAGWPIAGVGLAAVVGGIITFTLKGAAQEDFDAIFDPANRSQLDAKQLTEAEELAKDGHALNSATYVLIYGGGAFALTGATLLILGYLSGDSPEVDVQAAFGPDGGQIGVSWTW